ncbi:hypothetical protein CA983_33415 [Streptomyces swartbergensis]|uniref:Uncharacterized protein n=1 Tax=Streptomyces swartbergensis TaxID=487165 RepID=A0A243RKN9_9ACTN|nr:hypothetical protein CA983_33415 [Streptomyces swartbergensis]
MSETVHVSTVGLLVAISPWLVLVGMLLFLIPGPVQRWGLGVLEHLDGVLCGAGSLNGSWGGVRGVGLFRTGCGRSRSR